MDGERNVFLMNGEQKILVFLDGDNKILVPNLSEEKNQIKLNISKNVEDYELVTAFDKRIHFNKIENNETIKVEYYASVVNLTDELRKEIGEICEENNLLVDFLSIREIQDLLELFRKEKNGRNTNNKEISKSLRVLKRKLKYREY